MNELISIRAARDLMPGSQGAITDLNKKIEEAAKKNRSSVIVPLDTVPHSLRILLVEKGFEYRLSDVAGFAKIGW